MPKGSRVIIMKTIEISISQGAYENLTKFAELKNMPIEKVIARLVERFAPATHTMTVEELALGYAASGEENLDWANL